MRETPEAEKAFIAEFQVRLLKTRQEMDWSRERLAKALGITKDMLKHYETRDISPFPIYLLPKLVETTHKPLHYWLGMPADDSRRGRAGLSLVGR